MNAYENRKWKILRERNKEAYKNYVRLCVCVCACVCMFMNVYVCVCVVLLAVIVRVVIVFFSESVHPSIPTNPSLKQ